MNVKLNYLDNCLQLSDLIAFIESKYINDDQIEMRLDSLMLEYAQARNLVVTIEGNKITFKPKWAEHLSLN